MKRIASRESSEKKESLGKANPFLNRASVETGDPSCVEHDNATENVNKHHTHNVIRNKFLYAHPSNRAD